ncbi:MAG: methylated-DNA--[protein]-cysteine S-methyltransferase [Desulfobacterales bacterium]|nr:methylated-DNA--[protein]-cysteine S-methyltransferase [Desulfobacterales bacterium]
MTMIGAIRGRAKVCSPLFHTAACRVEWLAFYVIAADTGIAGLTFSRAAHVRACERISRRCANARFATDRGLGREIASAVSRYLQGRSPGVAYPVCSLLLAAGTPFQQRVWQRISGISPGMTRTYGELAVELGGPGYARAVARACAANPLALIVPCHRVVGARGPGGFAGGATVKQRLLQLEAARN